MEVEVGWVAKRVLDVVVLGFAVTLEMAEKRICFVWLVVMTVDTVRGRVVETAMGKEMVIFFTCG